MKKVIIHLSDLHFRQNWEEDQGLVLDAFFKDLSKQIIQTAISNVYIAFSGDVVLAGDNSQLYEDFLNQFNIELTKLKIPKNRRICVPGNHDVSVKFINENSVVHEGVVAQRLNEKDFNDYIQKQPKILKDKFDNYKAFDVKFADYGISDNILSGAGWAIDENIGVYCLNTAICSSGGYNNINDKERLAIDTRSINKWILECKSKIKILVMHHPIEWLRDWAQVEIKKLLRNKFSLCLSGHLHDQFVFHSINKIFSLVECSAPPLLTNKKDNLGYSFISVSEKGVIDIQYRQWTKNNTFVTGVNFSDTDDGKVIVKREDTTKDNEFKDVIGRMLSNRLDDALRSFSSQPIVWVEPILSKTNELSRDADDNTENNMILADFISNPKSTIIKAPPQFGLTCLARHLAKEAWNLDSFLWLYLDSKNIKSSHRVDRAVKKKLKILGVEKQRVNGIILDSWTNLEKDSLKLLKNLSESHKNIPIIVMQTIDDSKFMSKSNNETINREFEVLYLLALPRGHIRKVVSAYNDERHIGDEDVVITKVISDLQVLNIHRTPLNCLTLLKVSEKYFDESPVNRTKMLEMVLFLLFNMEEIPTYKTKPDLKDCEYVLGRFCEKIIRERRNYFSREEFSKEIESFCSEKLIDLEVDIVFDVLHSNQIIIKSESQYSFRFSYWIYYFAAQRMHHDKDFANYIFEEKRYASFPEIIEFYTGIDRRREDALKILIKDIRETCDTVHNKVGLPDGMNPYRLVQWSPTPEVIEKMQIEISKNVLNSNLPTSVKDQHADRGYDQIRAYDQSIHTILHEYSLVLLMQSTKASSRALRNSDYVNPEIKRELLNEIMRSWEQISKVLFALTPLLAQKGNAVFEGAAFMLCGDFGKTLEERINTLLENIPYNVVSMYNNDLFSNKMGPLLFKQIDNESNDLKRHELILLLIYNKPRNWKKQVENYIVSISKNSFFLFDIVNTLCTQYRYSFASPIELKEMKYLIKMGLAKHKFGTKKPLLDKIVKISNKALPKRKVDV